MVSRGGKAYGVVLVLYYGVMMGLYSLTWYTDGVALVLYHGVLADGIVLVYGVLMVLYTLTGCVIAW